MTDNVDFAKSKFGPLYKAQLLILIGSALGVFSLIMSWTSADFPLGRFTPWAFAFGPAFYHGWSGVQVIYRFLPFIAWIFALAALTLVALPFFDVKCCDKYRRSSTWSRFAIVAGALMIALPVIWTTWNYNGVTIYNTTNIGYWMMTVGGLLTLAGGIMFNLKEKLSCTKIAIIIGGAMCIYSLFEFWTADAAYMVPYTGWEFAFSSDFSNVKGFQKYLPFIAWLFAIIVFAYTVLSMIKTPKEGEKNTVSAAVAAAGGIIVLLFCAIWGVWTWDPSTMLGLAIFPYVDIGFYLMFVGGALMLIGAVAPMVKRRPTALQLIILFGAILGINAVFMGWIYSSGTYVIGMDFAFNSNFNDVKDFQKYLPFIAWIFAMLTALISVVTLVKTPAEGKDSSKLVSVIALLAGLIMIVLCIVWGLWEPQNDGEKCISLASAGFNQMLVSGFILLLAGLAPFIGGKLGKKKEDAAEEPKEQGSQ